MDHDFWRANWADNRIAFHEGQANALLVAHFDQLNLPEHSRIFLPLCGKTRDIAWLLSNGHAVAGAELSEIAVTQLFEELEINPEISQIGALKRYQGANIDIFVGDIFSLTAQNLGQIDAIADRAALVALPQTMRQDYIQHLATICATAPQLLITFEYDQTVMPGPPFSLTETVVRSYYDAKYYITSLAAIPAAGKLKGQVDAIETIWKLEPKHRD